MFSKTCEYAFRAVAAVAQASANGVRLTLPVIAEMTGTPQAFMGKIMQDLVKARIVRSYRGPSGGFDLPMAKAAKVNLRMVMDALGGGMDNTLCVMGIGECNSGKPCPMHNDFVEVRKDISRILANTYVDRLAKELNTGATDLKK